MAGMGHAEDEAGAAKRRPASLAKHRASGAPSGIALTPSTGGKLDGKMRRQSAPEADRRDAARQPGRIVGLHNDSTQRAGTLGDLEPLARHLSDEPGYRRRLLHADDGIVVAAHARTGYQNDAGMWGGRDSVLRQQKPAAGARFPRKNAGERLQRRAWPGTRSG